MARQPRAGDMQQMLKQVQNCRYKRCSILWLHTYSRGGLLLRKLAHQTFPTQNKGTSTRHYLKHFHRQCGFVQRHSPQRNQAHVSAS